MVKADLLVCLFLLALGGWLLHHRIHPYTKGAVYAIPFVCGLVSTVCVPLLFCSRKTLNLAYLLNGFLSIAGMILMTHFSVKHFEGQLTLLNILMNTLFADIGLAFAKLLLGKAIYELEYLKSETDKLAAGRFWRYPEMGWWWAHLAGMTLVYGLGHILWK